jgi:hypothetical protein
MNRPACEGGAVSRSVWDLIRMIDAKIAQRFKRQYAKLTADEIMVLTFLRD